jgi:hypothetical protein
VRAATARNSSRKCVQDMMIFGNPDDSKQVKRAPFYNVFGAIVGSVGCQTRAFLSTRNLGRCIISSILGNSGVCYGSLSVENLEI